MNHGWLTDGDLWVANLGNVPVLFQPMKLWIRNYEIEPIQTWNFDVLDFKKEAGKFRKLEASL